VHDYMAANVWCLYVIWNKFAVNLFKRFTTGEKVPLNFDLNEISDCKRLSFWLSAIALVPLIYKMAFTPNLKDNFCLFVGTVNFVAFNFGFHVHEKAMLMVYIPLLMGAKTDRDKLRVKFLGTVMIWTLLPLIPGQVE
jgi:hypothetical protein